MHSRPLAATTRHLNTVAIDLRLTQAGASAADVEKKLRKYVQSGHEFGVLNGREGSAEKIAVVPTRDASTVTAKLGIELDDGAALGAAELAGGFKARVKKELRSLLRREAAFSVK